MLHPEILPIELQVPSLAILLAFLAWVVWLIRRQKLNLRESLLWLLTTLVATIFTAFPRLLVLAAQAIGVKVPANAVFGVGLLYVAVNVLSVTLVASANASRVRRLAQECALLRAEIADLRGERPASPGNGATPEPEGRGAGRP